MTPQQATDDINDDYRFANVESATGAQLYNDIDGLEEAALDLSDADELFRLYNMSGDVLVGPNTRARSFLIQTFPNGTASYDALIETFRSPISRATELGLPAIKLGWTETVWPY